MHQKMPPLFETTDCMYKMTNSAMVNFLTSALWICAINCYANPVDIAPWVCWLGWAMFYASNSMSVSYAESL